MMDNHSAHGTPDIEDLRVLVKCTFLRLPKATSYFNPIEWVWGLMKKKWRTALLRKGADATQEWMTRTLIDICAGIDRPTLQRLSTAHFHEINAFLASLENEPDETNKF